MAHHYDIGTRAWQPDVEQAWVPSEVIDKRVDGENVTLVFRLDNDEVSFLRICLENVEEQSR